MNDKKEHFSIKRRMKSFAFAYNGIKCLVIKEHNARIHISAFICVIILGVLLRIELIEWIFYCNSIREVFLYLNSLIQLLKRLLTSLSLI